MGEMVDCQRIMGLFFFFVEKNNGTWERKSYHPDEECYTKKIGVSSMNLKQLWDEKCGIKQVARDILWWSKR